MIICEYFTWNVKLYFPLSIIRLDLECGAREEIGIIIEAISMRRFVPQDFKTSGSSKRNRGLKGWDQSKTVYPVRILVKDGNPVQRPDSQPEGSPVGADSRARPQCSCGLYFAHWVYWKPLCPHAKSPNTHRESDSVNNERERNEGKS